MLDVVGIVVSVYALCGAVYAVENYRPISDKYALLNVLSSLGRVVFWPLLLLARFLKKQRPVPNRYVSSEGGEYE